MTLEKCAFVSSVFYVTQLLEIISIASSASPLSHCDGQYCIDCARLHQWR